MQIFVITFLDPDIYQNLIAFQNIDEPARISPKTVFEEFSVHFQRIDHTKLCFNDADLLYQTGQVFLAFFWRDADIA